MPQQSKIQSPKGGGGVLKFWTNGHGQRNCRSSHLMKFNPLTKQLFTEDGRLIKRMHCPFRLDWRKLQLTEDVGARRCGICQHEVTDTALRTEEELLALLAEHPEACLKVDLNQPNLTITYQS